MGKHKRHKFTGSATTQADEDRFNDQLEHEAVMRFMRMVQEIQAGGASNVDIAIIAAEIRLVIDVMYPNDHHKPPLHWVSNEPGGREIDMEGTNCYQLFSEAKTKHQRFVAEVLKCSKCSSKATRIWWIATRDDDTGELDMDVDLEPNGPSCENKSCQLGHILHIATDAELSQIVEQFGVQFETEPAPVHKIPGYDIYVTTQRGIEDIARRTVAATGVA